MACLIFSVLEMVSFLNFIYYKNIKFDKLTLLILTICLFALNIFLIEKTKEISDMRRIVKHEPKLLKYISFTLVFVFIGLNIYWLIC